MGIFHNDVSGYEWPDQWVHQISKDEAARRGDPFFNASMEQLAENHGMQHGGMVHVLFENGTPCDKWVSPIQ